MSNSEAIKTPQPSEKQKRFRRHAATIAKLGNLVMKELLKDCDPAWRELAQDWKDEFVRLQVDLEDMEKDFCEECGEEIGKCLCAVDSCCPTCQRDFENCECSPHCLHYRPVPGREIERGEA